MAEAKLSNSANDQQTLDWRCLRTLNELQKEEVEVLSSIFPDRIRLIINDTSGRGESVPVLNVTVPLKSETVDSSRLKIDVYLDAEDKSDEHFDGNSSVKQKTKEKTTENIPEAVRPSFERSVSGKRFRSTIFTTSPPHLDIYLVLCVDYPEKRPPDFTISSVWLSNSQLDAICKKLDSLWNENLNFPILFLWFDWLENECLNFLGISSIVLSSQNEDVDVDCRVSLIHNTVEDRLLEILKFDMQKEDKFFSTTVQTCPICYDTKFGSEFCRLDNCWHYFCCDCLESYIRMHVEQGTIQYLSCPDEKCKSPIPVNVLKRFLTDEQWQRWDSLSLSMAIENIHDLDWCPRCRMPCEKEKDHATSFLARCPYCSFSFCTSCREPWHQGVPCRSLEQKLNDLENVTDGGSDVDRFEAVAQRMRQLKNQILSVIKLKITTKPCPGCLVPIEKNEGCNHVICIKCETHMCWLCGQKIAGYGHFGSSCQTFTTEAENDRRQREIPPINEKHIEMVAILQLNPEQRRNVAPCAACGADNLKTFRNNHLRCYNCRSSYCFLCRKRIVGSVKDHFKPPKPCLQHSGD